jgi:hypothetical protein
MPKGTTFKLDNSFVVDYGRYEVSSSSSSRLKVEGQPTLFIVTSPQDGKEIFKITDDLRLEFGPQVKIGESEKEFLESVMQFLPSNKANIINTKCKLIYAITALRRVKKELESKNIQLSDDLSNLTERVLQEGEDAFY